MSDNAEYYIQVACQLEVLLRRELALYREVCEISRKQVEVISNNDTSILMQMINEKQLRIHKIDAIEVQAKSLKAERENSLESWPAEARAKVDPLVRELQAVLGEIVALEDQSRSAAEGIANSSSQKVEHIQRGKAMLNAYGKAAKGVPFSKYKDKKG